MLVCCCVTRNEAASDQTAAKTRSEVYRAEQKLLIDAFFSSHPDHYSEVLWFSKTDQN
jgi:hypothetical protein